MARTTISNAEFMAWAKTRRRLEDSADNATARSSGQIGLSTTPTSEKDAPTGASGVRDRLPSLVLVIPPINTVPATTGGKGRRRVAPLPAARRNGASVEKLRGHWPLRSLVATFGWTRMSPIIWVLASRTC
ncbi:hypothetical protein DEO72_LG10g3937 [Vigna unguiculata]|uniref:Uncharacterized protein n=1 Tax=Vigna unguiculata TaxID=3917 RepID=A0A4D6NJ88_VIGUN|nr:hypothetical protein DEO72_LG10g3937 [Vigna unguiculata]